MERRAFVAATAASAARVLGANERIRVGVIGAGGRGRLLTREFKEIGAEMAAVCDVYEPHLAAGLKLASTGARPFDNYKKVLEDKSLDAVIVATPDHWHARMAIDAVEAGKDVYLEKVMAHTLDEGFRIVEAVRRTKRVVQVGTQRRSDEVFLEAKQIMGSGVLGPVRLVNAWWLNNESGPGQRPLEGKLDWDQWLGPAPKRPLDPARFLGWWYFWDYTAGFMVGQGAHIVDAISWLMGSTFPSAVTCTGGRPLPGAEVPLTTCLSIEYPENYLAVFTVGYEAMRYRTYCDQLKQFHGSQARFDVGREFFALYPQDPLAMEVKPTKTISKPGSFVAATRNHIRNFLECIRSRKDPNATVEMGNCAAVTLAIATQSLRTGRRLRFNPQTRKVEA